MSTTTRLGRPISVRLPEGLRVRIETLATASRRSQGDVVRELIEREISDLEWEQRIAARAVELRSGRMQTVPLGEIERDLGLTGKPVDPRILDDVD